MVTSALLGVYIFTAGLPSSPLTGVSTYTLAYYAAVVTRLRLHRWPASIAADWCPRLYDWLVTPPFMGVHVFTDRLAFDAADWCFRLHG
ncbi:HGWP repeat containing protein-like [Oryza sativa Japonica Group]|uniref:HGWP repeat containing protein-like n=1 Tax=Oryza sativa subsp. japonica TaxID=39947 RepID=Q5ZCQ0_ORYSJ|nr:HGWP repeat containing protein-like [Oryza sativa Japonica Group]